MRRTTKQRFLNFFQEPLEVAAYRLEGIEGPDRSVGLFNEELYGCFYKWVDLNLDRRLIDWARRNKEKCFSLPELVGRIQKGIIAKSQIDDPILIGRVVEESLEGEIEIGDISIREGDGESFYCYIKIFFW